MKITIHCFAENVKIEPNSFDLIFKDFHLQLWSMAKTKEENQVALRLSKKLSALEIDEFQNKIGDDDNPDEFFANRTRKYSEYLIEAAQLVEGLFSILYGVAPPKFDTSKPMVNLVGENQEEFDLLDSDKIMRGFGFVNMPEAFPLYHMEDKIKAYVSPAIGHLAALSFLSQAKRSMIANDHEVAFFLYFRILDGYFAHGKQNITTTFLKKEAELRRYIDYDDRVVAAVKGALRELGRTSKSSEEFSGLLEDLVTIRHQLTHFSSRKPEFYHSPKVIFELATINGYLDKACTNKLRGEICV
jgi:hypothetical protein